ncbi:MULTISPECIES: hypothetical protein [unclassified Caballeronia]|jgi:hypothetical protein|uniref:T6SS immunity protein Tli3 family protein n=1 Tax=unclassified Caballeronia TaxID=2646786 RepID=UPI00285ED6F0|nr:MULTISPECIES: hypothetical protein [unclassified Caballeronia]MDR5750069.1 hypothetical protein [Caballeronia sp. LZ024]MDR5842803.1 hypothetical protein [Caballeronia sp. LZ031]
MKATKLAVLLSLALLTACVSDAERARYSESQPTPTYDVAPQVIYRIDDHRFISLENYSDCNHGDTYYNDTKEGIRKKLGRNGIENFQGRLINADPTGRNIVIPSSQPPERACSDRGCSISLIYSTDSGRTFQGMVYMKTFDPFNRSRDYTMATTRDALYVLKRGQVSLYVIRYPLVQGFTYGTNQPLPGGMRIEFDVQMPSGLRSPSGQERFTCDASIRPSNLEKSK